MLHVTVVHVVTFRVYEAKFEICSVSSSRSCIKHLLIVCNVANSSLGSAVPPGDEGWLCPVCECKLECIEVINAYLGTNFEMENSWEVRTMLIRCMYGLECRGWKLLYKSCLDLLSRSTNVSEACSMFVFL